MRARASSAPCKGRSRSSPGTPGGCGGITSSRSLLICWQSAGAGGVSPSRPTVSRGSTPIVSCPHAISVQTTRASGSFLFLARWRAGSFAHEAGPDVTSLTALAAKISERYLEDIYLNMLN